MKITENTLEIPLGLGIIHPSVFSYPNSREQKVAIAIGRIKGDPIDLNQEIPDDKKADFADFLISFRTEADIEKFRKFLDVCSSELAVVNLLQGDK